MLVAQGPDVRRVPGVELLGVQGRVRGGRAALVRVVGFDQRRAHVETVQEAAATRAVGRAHGTVRARVQAAQSQPETLPGAHPRGGRLGNVSRTVLRGRRRDRLRRTAIHSAQGQVSDVHRHPIINSVFERLPHNVIRNIIFNTVRYFLCYLRLLDD